MADVGRAVRTGWMTARRHKKVVVCFYLLNLMMALALLPVLADSIDRSLGSGDYRQRVSESLDLEWLEVLHFEALSSLARTLTPMVIGAAPFADHLERLLDLELSDLPLSLLAPALLFWLLNSLLHAAALGSAALDPAGCSWRELLRTGSEFWARFLRLGLISLALFYGAHRIFVGPFRDQLEVWALGQNSARVELWTSLTVYIVALLVFLVIHLVFSYARVITASEDRTSVTLAFFSACAFCLNRPLPVVLLGGLMLIPLGAWIFFKQLIERLIAQDQLWGVGLVLVLSQLSLLVWMGVRFWFWLAEMELFRASRTHNATKG